MLRQDSSLLHQAASYRVESDYIVRLHRICGATRTGSDTRCDVGKARFSGGATQVDGTAKSMGGVCLAGGRLSAGCHSKRSRSPIPELHLRIVVLYCVYSNSPQFQNITRLANYMTCSDR